MSRPLPAAVDDPLARSVRLVWPNLPVLAGGSALVAIVWAFARLLAGGTGWLLVLGVGLLVLPTLGVLLHGCQILLADDHFGIPVLFRRLPRDFARSAAITAGPTILVLLTAAAVRAWQIGQLSWMIPSVAVGGALSAVAVGTGVIALPYHLQTGGRWRDSWLVSAYLASRNPVPVLSIAAAVALTVWSTAHLSFALVLLLPAPLALIWAAAASTAVRRGRDRLAPRP